MATEKEANMAREKHLGYLDKMGAHAITVNEITQSGKKTFAVVAYAEKQPDNVPDHLEIAVGNKTLNVPLVVTVASKFKLE